MDKVNSKNHTQVIIYEINILFKLFDKEYDTQCIHIFLSIINK